MRNFLSIQRLMFVMGIILVGLVCLVVIRASLLQSLQPNVKAVTDITVDQDFIAQHLAEAIRYKTISFQKAPKGEAFRCTTISSQNTRLEEDEAKPFDKFHDFLRNTYPKVHSTLTKEVINQHSLLYTWEGTDSALKPILIMAHQDVVPIESEKKWDYPPFAGEIAKGYIWGRGAIDDKGPLIAIFEAIEFLISQGFRPARTIYFAFGHDEEIGGKQGAAEIAKQLNHRGLQFEFILDEGTPITKGIILGIAKPVAVIAIAEKGYLTLELCTIGKGGHSSMPPKTTAVSIIAKAVNQLVENPFPSRFDGVVESMFEALAPEVSFSKQLIFANLWLTKPLVKNDIASKPTTNAAIRTTMAPTMLSGSTKENVLPQSASAVINFRILPGETTTSVIKRVETIINDSRVTVRPLNILSEPSKISDSNSASFDLLRRTVREVFPNTIVAPSLLMATTDSKFYARLATNTYRFNPITMIPGDPARIHGLNERISVQDMAKAVKFYIRLFKRASLPLT